MTKEPTTLDWIKSLEKDSILIDIGANIGIYTIPCALFHVKKVIAIEPGPIRTEIWKKNLNKMDEFEDSSYFKILQNANKIIKNSEQNALPVEKVSKLIAKCLIVDRPKTRYIVHKKKFVFRIMAYYFSDKLADWLVYKTLSSENRHRPF